MSTQIHVAVGILIDDLQRVLIAQRPLSAHQGGFWEFPGGKVEAGETVVAALQREFEEEVGVVLHNPAPFLKIQHDYADKSVLLDVWLSREYSGEASGKEGQPVRWCPLAQLRAEDFPAANAAIVKALQLPNEIAITPDVSSLQELDSLLHGYAQQQLELLQFRQPQLSEQLQRAWYEHALAFCQNHNMQLMFNGEPDNLPVNGLHHWHCAAWRLSDLLARPVAADALFSVSCHNLHELQQAAALQADFALLSPVAITKHYSSEDCLGWEGFAELAASVSLPVYALGGLQRADLSRALQTGAFGIAGIAAYSKPA